MPTNLMRAKPLVFDNNDEEQMEIKNENENIQEPLTNEPGCSNDHHFRRVKTAVAEGQKKCVNYEVKKICTSACGG
ncbi:hypothetical protein T10_7838 [Trichinella papuae]|uniref:Uncharacterized protein n=1 Tax=Trichinella papuae TaxID=268474 RepID=A0A0V1M3D6_9BILA|nr:hypothetical protein T10_1918 [Trichinella papuae]KRZ66708.1 hypothetical protein T10_7838 [Trichinella papuae]